MTGSLVNNLMANGKTPMKIEVGMGATFCHWSDRSPGTVVEVKYFKSGARKGQVSAVVVQADDYKRTDKNGMSECQTYEFTPNPNGGKTEFKVKKNGKFEGLALGHRDAYYDFSF